MSIRSFFRSRMRLVTRMMLGLVVLSHMALDVNAAYAQACATIPMKGEIWRRSGSGIVPGGGFVTDSWEEYVEAAVTYTSGNLAPGTILTDVNSYYSSLTITALVRWEYNGAITGWFSSQADFVSYCPDGYTPSGSQCVKTGNPNSQLCPQDGKKQGPPDYCMAGNPIDQATGNKYQAERDYSGAGPFPLVFERYYNSAFGAASPARLGRGWRSNYDRTVSFVKRPFVPDGTVVGVTRPTGRKVYFSLDNSSWIPEVGVTDKLEAVTNGSGQQIAWKFTSSLNDEIETYDMNGKLTSITNRAGLQHTLAYDVQRRLVSVTDSFGKSLTFTYYDYNGAGMMSSMTDSGGGVYQFTYDDRWWQRLIGVSYPNAVVRTYVYESTSYPNLLTGIVDENSSRFATWAYDGQGRANLSERAVGVDLVTIQYTDSTGSSTVTDAFGAARQYSFTTIGGAAKNASITGSPFSYCTVPSNTTYDSNGYIASTTDWNGNRTNYVHDARGLETSRTEGLTSGGGTTPQTRTITTTWHSTFRLPTQLAEPGRTTTFAHDANGNVLTKTVTAGSSSRTWTYTYNANGSVLTINGPRTDVSDVTTYTYYDNAATCPGAAPMGCRGQVETVTNAAGHVTSIAEYNAHSQPLSITDPNGLVTTLSYDSRQRLTSWSMGTETTSYDYDNAGQLTKVTLPDSSFVSYTYDAAHRLKEIADNLGNKIVYTLDAMGNRTLEEVRDPLNALVQTRTRVYSTLNRLTQAIGGTGQVTAYGFDNQGNITSIDGPLSGSGDTTTQLYDALNRLVRVTDPASGQVNYGHDSLDQLTSVSDPRSLATNYTVTGLGDLTQQVSPDTGTTTNTHDAAGNVLTSTDAEGRLSTYTYDELNRVSQIVYTKSGLPGVTITLGYDTGTNGKGRLTSMTDSSGNTSWVYDAKGQVISRTQTVSGSSVSFIVQYHYDSAGRLDQITYPSGRVVAMGFDALGRVASLTQNGNDLVAGATYFPFGQVKGFTLNGNAVNRSFDTDGRPTGYTLAWESRVLGYDNASRITSNQRADTSDPRSYGYDNLDRLTSYTSASTSQGFSYDATGNRTGTTLGATSYTYTTPGSSNRLSSVTASGFSRTFVYDATGNTTSSTGDQPYTATYDARGRLTQVQVGANTTTYLVNGVGQRVQKAGPLAPSGTNYFVYDEMGRLLGEYDATGAVIQETIYLNDLPVATVKAAGTYYIYADHLNTPREIANTWNQVVWRWDSDPFGINVPNEDPSGLGTFEHNARFPGQYFDKETNLHYNYFRDYDSGIGRYLQSDPIGLGGGVNTFTYVEGNPLSYSDTKGLFGQQLFNPIVWVPPLAIAAVWASQNPEAARALWNAINSSSSSDPPSANASPATGGAGDFCVQNPADPICQDQQKKCPGADRQFGRKFGEHRDLTRSGYRTHQEYRALADRIYQDPGAQRTVFPRDARSYAGETHIQVGKDLLRLDPSGNFRSLYPVP